MNSSVGLGSGFEANVVARPRPTENAVTKVSMDDKFLELRALRAIGLHEELPCEYAYGDIAMTHLT